MAREFGRVNWKDWTFDYGVIGSEGLCLTDGFFRRHRLFNKLSLPVIRVKYLKDEILGSNFIGVACGPYNDRIHWDTDDWGEDLNGTAGPHHLVKWPEGTYIRVQEITNNQTLWCELSIYARIGAYHIIQSWSLNNDGVIKPMVYSKGLSCNVDHWHHPHWRFDFDLPGPTPQQVSVFDHGTWLGTFEFEGSLVNSHFGDAHYLISNPDTGAFVWVIPPKPDEDHGIVGPTSFSPIDGYIRLYRASEDRPWEFKEEHEMHFEQHERIDRGNVVFWSICHLFHRAAEGPFHLHGVGPQIIADIPAGRFPVIYPDPQVTAANDFRTRNTLAKENNAIGAFPNFFEATYNNQHVGGTIFVRPPLAEWLDVPLSALGSPGNPPPLLDDFRGRFKATEDYARPRGYVGGFPNFFHADYGLGIVCGTILIKTGGGEWRDVPLNELEGVTDLNDIGARFKATQIYAEKHGFVGGFPNFYHADHHDGRGIVCGTILLNRHVAEWKDLYLYKLPF